MSSFTDVTGPTGPLGPTGPAGATGPAGPSVAFLAEDHTVQNVYNTTAEVNVLSYNVAAGLIKAGDRLRIKLLYNCVQNAIAVQYWHRLKFAGAQVMAISVTPTVQAVNRTVIDETFEIQFLATNNSVIYGHFLMSSPGSTIGVAEGTFPTAYASASQSQGLGTNARDWAAGMLLQVSSQPNQLRGDSDHQVWGWTIQRIPAS